MSLATDFTLDELIGMEDALEAMRDGVDRDAYLGMHVLRSKDFAAHVWDAAQVEVWAHNASSRRALNFIRRGIESFR